MRDYSKMSNEELIDEFIQLIRSEEYYFSTGIDYDTWCCDFENCTNEIMRRIKICKELVITND